MMELNIDGHKFFTTAEDKLLRQLMYSHIRTERKKGRQLKDIVFCWGRVEVVHHSSLRARYAKELAEHEEWLKTQKKE